MPVSHVVIIFFTTAGQNGENLGSDEEQIVQVTYLLYDVVKNQPMGLQWQYVRPTSVDIAESERVLTEECRIQTGLSEDRIRQAQHLPHVLTEVERWMQSMGVHPELGGRQVEFVTDGQLHFRACLHPEAMRKSIPLPPQYYSFFDLRREYRKMQKSNIVINCIRDMIENAGLKSSQIEDYGVRQCQDMAAIIKVLLDGGHEFTEPEVVRDRLEPGVYAKDENIDDDTVVRTRGLPWQSSDQDIARFFKGLNVAKGGVALCLSPQGRRNGEALVRFENREHRDLALRRHKHHIGQRYIEVYRASGKDFLSIASGKSSEAQNFLARHSAEGGQVIIRMRGLPYTATAEHVLQFFASGEQPANVMDGEEGILFVHQADGRSTGDAFVLFASEDEAVKALTKHRQLIGTRYIELFKSTASEVQQQVLNRSLDPRLRLDAATIQLIQQPHLQPELYPQLLPQFTLAPAAQTILLPQTIVPVAPPQRNCIRLRGLPFEASVNDILTFLGEFARFIVYQGVHLIYNSQGIPSGETLIQMDSEASAEATALARHKRYMLVGSKKRYVEVLQCSSEELGINSAVLPPPATYLTSPSPSQTLLSNQLITANGQPTVTMGGAMPPMTTPSPAAYGLVPYSPIVNGGVSMPIPPPTAQQPMAQSIMTPVVNGTAVSSAPPLGQVPIRSMAYTNGYQPFVYIYPTQPISPQGQYYLTPNGMPVKGVQYSPNGDLVHYADVSYAEMSSPEALMQRQTAAMETEGGIMTFAPRPEQLDRALLAEQNKQLLALHANRFVEVRMA